MNRLFLGSLFILSFLVPVPSNTQEEKLTTEKILTISASGKTKFTIDKIPETGTYFLRAINQEENPIIFYVYENETLTLLASNKTKNGTYEETLTLSLSKDKTYQVIFSPLKPISKVLRFSLVKSSLGKVFENLYPIPTAEAIRPTDDSLRAVNLATFHTSSPLYSYDSAMYNDIIYIAYQERIADKVVVSYLRNGQWETLGEPAISSQEKIFSFKIAISSEGKVYLAFLSRRIKNQTKLNVITYNGNHWIDISPSINGALGDIFDFNIRDKSLSLLYTLPNSNGTCTLQVLTNQGFGREWLALSPLEPIEKVTLKGLTLIHSQDLSIGYNVLSGRDKIFRIMTYRNSQWLSLEAPTQANAILHSLINTEKDLIFANITKNGNPSLRFYHNNIWQSIPLKLKFSNPLSLSITTSKNESIFLSISNLKNFIVLVTRDRNTWQYVGSRPFFQKVIYTRFIEVNTERAVLSYQTGSTIIFDELELK